MHVLTILQRTGEVDAATLNVLSTVWNRLKGKEGAKFTRLTAKIWKGPPTVIDYDVTAKKKATLYAVKIKGLLAKGMMQTNSLHLRKLLEWRSRAMHSSMTTIATTTFSKIFCR